MRPVLKLRLATLAVGVVVLAAGCTSSPEPTKTEVFGGRLTLKPKGLAYENTDSVVLTVEGSYYGLSHFTHFTRLCDSKGTVDGFGSNRCFLNPTQVGLANCDSLSVPRNFFTAIFRGDSLYLIQDADSNVFKVTYTFRLKSWR